MQARFEAGLACLHNFGYDEALDEFRRAQALDPTFAMAYWGEAMCHYRPVWHIEDVAAGRGALIKLGTSRAGRLAKGNSPRERAYLEAAEALFGDAGDQPARHTAFTEAMRRISEDYPTDVDAAAFYAFALIGMVPPGVYDDARLGWNGGRACVCAESPASRRVYEYVQQGRFERSRNALTPLEEALAADPNPWMKNELATWRAYYILGSQRWTEVANRQAFDNADELFALGMRQRRQKTSTKAGRRWTC